MTKAKEEESDIEEQTNTLLTQATEHPVDRPGCDIGGSTRLMSAGFGIGLAGGPLDSRFQIKLPRRRLIGKLSISQLRSPDIA